MASTEGKTLVNAAYESAVICGLAIGYAQLGKKLLKGPTPKLDLNAYDISLTTVYIGLGLATKDILVKQGIIPDVILK